jgi:hypothetical protein
LQIPFITYFILTVRDMYCVTHIYVIEGNTSYTSEELLAILVERHEANKLQRTVTGIILYILDY